MISSEETKYYNQPIGITNPPIDELLAGVKSKYALAVVAAKRARQINQYYNQLHYGMMEQVGPLLDPFEYEKPLSIALREIHHDLVEIIDSDSEIESNSL